MNFFCCDFFIRDFFSSEKKMPPRRARGGRGGRGGSQRASRLPAAAGVRGNRRPGRGRGSRGRSLTGQRAQQRTQQRINLSQYIIMPTGQQQVSNTDKRNLRENIFHDGARNPTAAERNRLKQPRSRSSSVQVTRRSATSRPNYIGIPPKFDADFLHGRGVVTIINNEEYINLKGYKAKLDRVIKAYEGKPPPDDMTAREHYNNNGEDINAFVGQEMNRLLIGDIDSDGQREFAAIVDVDPGDSEVIAPLIVPVRFVREFPFDMMLYILYALSKYAKEHPSFDISWDLAGTRNVATDEQMNPLKVVNGHISKSDLAQLYLLMLNIFRDALPVNKYLWNGSEESGTTILFYDLVGNITIILDFSPAAAASVGGRWTPQLGKLFEESPLRHYLVTSANKDDNKCFIYCLIMGLLCKYDEAAKRVFGDSGLCIDPSTIFSVAIYRYPDNGSTVLEKIHNLAKCTLPLMDPSEENVELRNLWQLTNKIDKTAGTVMSLGEFRRTFEEIEKNLGLTEVCGIDILGMDFNINPHIYPLYVSENRHEIIITLLCVTPKHETSSHFFLIKNMAKIFAAAGGKDFFSCSICGKTFFHRRFLETHKCDGSEDPFAADRKGGYHFSKQSDMQENPEMIVGTCAKCRLCFTDDFSYEYHKEHCLMKGFTGYRHVQLVSYENGVQPTLDGEEIDPVEEERHVLKRRVLYSDFECCIEPETGRHQIMSYGLYDWESGKYTCGYELESFFDSVLNYAYQDEEKDNIYIYFHNAMGYDANFILRHILKEPRYESWGINVIMKSMNRLQKLTFYVPPGDQQKQKRIHIGDSFQFLTLSLERIVGSIRKESLEENKENFERYFAVFKKHYPFVSEEDINHILRKNIFPYRFFNSPEKLDTPIDQFTEIFSPKEENLQYFSETVTLEDLTKYYPDTREVITKFRCRNARDYHDIYLCCDVMQLADVFDRSMNILWESHHIHLTKYMGMPSATWAAFLRHNPEMSIPLYTETFYAEFFKGMTRGGVTSAAIRHAKADSTHSIIYVDVNGLYPYVMQAYNFPCGHFDTIFLNIEGEAECEAKLREQFAFFERTNIGMCYCVDMYFPDEVKQKTDLYPFAPEHRKIYSEYFQDLENKQYTPFLEHWSKENEGEKMISFTGLVCTLYPKEKYNVHWRTLRFYLDHGVKVTKVHFAVTFEEGDYLKGYIRKNIEIRNTRKDELGKTLYKLLGNAIYGKTYESPFKRNTFSIVRNGIKLRGLLDEGNIAAFTPIDDLGWIVRMDGEDIVLDKPTYIGACVCEFAKLHMYTLLYDKLMPIFPSCEMVYTDTDSFILKVEHPPEDLYPIHSPKDLFAYIKLHQPDLIGGIGGQIKSETGEDDTIAEIIALRSKVYAYKTLKGKMDKRAKGTTHSAQDMQLNWEIFKEVLEDLRSFSTSNQQFERKTFKVTSKNVIKKSLSANDGKRYICEDGIHTHAFGHPSVPSISPP